MREWKGIFHANGKQKKAGVAILISDKIDLKINNTSGDKEGHYIIERITGRKTKGSPNGEIKSFPDEQKLREFGTTKPALQQMLNGLI